MSKNEVSIALSDYQVGVLMGAISSFDGVPFYRIQKAAIDSDQQAALDAIFDRLAVIRKQYYRSNAAKELAVLMSDSDVDLLKEVVNACLQEYSDDPMGLHVYLNAKSGEDVQEALRILG